MMLLSLLAVICAGTGDALRLDFETINLPARNPQGFNLPLYNDLPHQRYLVNISVGTPPQPFAVTVDTGSADLWVPSPNSTGCAPHCPPTFDFHKSKTYVDTGLTFNASYGNGSVDSEIVGPYFNDTLGLGSVPPTFYQAGIFGLMGLGSPYQQTVVLNPSSPYYQDVNASFPLIYDQLYRYGFIQRRLFSLWLNNDKASTGSILFGAIDHSKYTGKLRSVPLVLSGPGRFTGWAVNLTRLTLNNGRPLLPTGSLTAVVLDSAAPNMYLPLKAANAIAQELNATSYQSFPYVSCALRRSRKVLTFEFGAARIAVKYGELIYPYGDPANIGPLKDADGKKLCYLGVIGTPGPLYLLGATFQRSAYVVYDVDSLEVQLAQSRID